MKEEHQVVEFRISSQSDHVVVSITMSTDGSQILQEAQRCMVQRGDHRIDGQKLVDVGKDEVRYIEYM